MRLRYTLAARRDLGVIYEHIAERNPAAAQRVEDHIRASIELLATWPRVGVATDLEDVRRLPIVRYPYAGAHRGFSSTTGMPDPAVLRDASADMPTGAGPQNSCPCRRLYYGALACRVASES